MEVVASGDEQGAGSVDADPVAGDERGGDGGHEGTELGVEGADLMVEVSPASSDGCHGDLGGGDRGVLASPEPGGGCDELRQREAP